MTKLKRITASCLAALSITGLLCIGANASVYSASHNWSALGRYVVGAPSSVNSEPDIFTIWHRKDGAIATMSGITHTTPGASGQTRIHCENFAMSDIVLHNYVSIPKKVQPSIGDPTEDIPVRYGIYASTNTVGDTVVSTGLIRKA